MSQFLAGVVIFGWIILLFTFCGVLIEKTKREKEEHDNRYYNS
jgi:hypothetical protein